MIVRATADLHGDLPHIEPCDVLLIGGDVCPVRGSHSVDVQSEWLHGPFSEWLTQIPAQWIVGIAGNHDFVMQARPDIAYALPWTYLCDEDVSVSNDLDEYEHGYEELEIWGTPWTPGLPRWAFQSDSGLPFEDIPEGIDILLSHGPPRGYGDKLAADNPWNPYGHVGHVKLADEIKRVQPGYVVCGHIHEGYGSYITPDTQVALYNVAYNDENYSPTKREVVTLAC